MASEKTSGDETADGTEETLATITDAGVYQLAIDLSNMADADSIIVRMKIKIRTGSTSLLVHEFVFANAAGDEKIAISPPLIVPHELICTLEQDAGTNRSYEWAIYQADA